MAADRTDPPDRILELPALEEMELREEELRRQREAAELGYDEATQNDETRVQRDLAAASIINTAALAPGFQYDNVFGVDPGRASVSTYVDIKSNKSHQISTKSF
ncbi:hypothetical protein ACKKBF_B41045 [Auxenochlorella protothecoides x Auxenochlorella symbiontica]